MHGGTDYNAIIRDAIIDYFNDRHGLDISTTAKSRPRTLAGSYDIWVRWCEWIKDGEQISLQLLNDRFRSEDAGEHFRSIVRPDDF